MKKFIDESLSIKVEELLSPYFEKLKIEFRKSDLYDDLIYENFCETIETYINQFKSLHLRNLNRNDILLFGGF